MGYAQLRSSRKLKPVKKKSHFGAWIGLSLAVAAAVALWLLRGGSSDVRAEYDAVEDDGRIGGDNRSYVTGTYDSSSGVLKIGDYSFLNDWGFCNRHGIDPSNVHKVYDSQRCAEIYRYTNDERVETPDEIITCTTCIDECSNRIVEQSFMHTMTPRNARGSAAIGDSLCSKIRYLSTHACRSGGTRVIDASPNVKYRGCDCELTERSLRSAVADALENDSEVKVQWKTPVCYIAWHFASLKQHGFYVSLITYSDQLISTGEE